MQTAFSYYNNLKIYKINIIGLISVFLLTQCESNEIKIKYCNSIFIETQINDSLQGNFVLDTGSPFTVFDSAFVINNHIKLDTIQKADNNFSNENLFEKISVSIFNNNVYSRYILVKDLKKLIPVEDGIIGLNFFYNKVIELNYSENYLKIFDNNYVVPQKFIKVPIKIINDRIYLVLNLEINDTVSLQGYFLLDTGYEGCIVLEKRISDSLNLQNVIKNKLLGGRKNGTLYANTQRYFFKANKCKISKFEVNDLMCSYTVNNNGFYLSDTLRKGSIGNLFLQKFDIIFDISKSSIYLKPNKNNYKEFTYFRSGLSIGQQIGEGYRIAGILEKSSAYKNNIKTGDILLKIDNKSVLELGYFKVKEILQTEGTYKMEFSRKDSVFVKEIEVFDIMKIL